MGLRRQTGPHWLSPGQCPSPAGPAAFSTEKLTLGRKSVSSEELPVRRVDIGPERPGPCPVHGTCLNVPHEVAGVTEDSGPCELDGQPAGTLHAASRAPACPRPVLLAVGGCAASLFTLVLPKLSAGAAALFPALAPGCSKPVRQWGFWGQEEPGLSVDCIWVPQPSLRGCRGHGRPGTGSVGHGSLGMEFGACCV